MSWQVTIVLVVLIICTSQLADAYFKGTQIGHESLLREIHNRLCNVLDEMKKLKPPAK